MATYTSNFLITLLLSSLLTSTPITARTFNTKSKSTLFTRLKLDEDGPTTCWDSLFELKSCSSEVVLFFLNGEAHLGRNCCNAIRIIQHQCWPSMMSSLGITPEESDILLGFCDASAGGGGSGGSSTLPPIRNNSTTPCICKP